MDSAVVLYMLYLPERNMAWTGMHSHSATDGFVMELCLHTNVRVAMVLQGNTFETSISVYAAASMIERV